jgi:hypothetical protein
VPVEFLSDAQAAAYGCYNRPVSRAELDRYFLLDGKALGLIEPKRRPHNRLGFALQLTTVHYLGRFLADAGADRGGRLPGCPARCRGCVVRGGLPGAGDDPARPR